MIGPFVAEYTTQQSHYFMLHGANRGKGSPKESHDPPTEHRAL